VGVGEDRRRLLADPLELAADQVSSGLVDPPVSSQSAISSRKVSTSRRS